MTVAVDRSRLARDSRKINIQMEQMANRCLAEAGITGVQALLANSVRDVEDQLYQDFSPEELSTLDYLQKSMLHNLWTFQTHSKREASAT